MRVALFYHSLLSDWNHGNAHFLRGIASELMARGHDVRIFEPRDAWSVQNLVSDYGEAPLTEFRQAYPHLNSVRYDLQTLDLDAVLEVVDFVIVHEWNAHELVAYIGHHRARAGNYVLLFHDTHHRSVTDAASMAAYDLRHYDGVLAFGSVIRNLYLSNGWAQRAWTWHEAADTRMFRPPAGHAYEGDVIWIGNWGDGERTAELEEFLLRPVAELGLRARVYGVRYPEQARQSLARAGVEYHGWVPNYRVPELFARFRTAVHIPRRPYARMLPGIPTIRVFEALACGIPLISAPWDDADGLFAAGHDFLVARDGAEMKQHLRALLNDEDLARTVARNGLEKILARHTCAHRVDELLDIHREAALQRVDPAYVYA